jgi:hypothetical protein
MCTSKFLKLYSDSKDTNAKFTIDCSGTNATFKSDLDLKLDCDLVVKQGAVLNYKSLSMEIFTNLPTLIESHYQQDQTDFNLVCASITNEIADRKSENAKEVSARTSADIELGVRIDNEISRATNAESSNNMSLDAKIASEESTRSSRDVQLTNKIKTEFSDLYNRMLYLESIVSSLRGESILYVATQNVHSDV